LRGPWLAVVLWARTALAVDPFEWQVYDGSANAPLRPGLEAHVNASTARALRLTLEPSYGLTPWWELGGYLQTAMTADGVYRYAGVKLRSKFVTPPDERRHWRLGLNVELDWLPDRFDPQRFGAELRPIVAYETAHWLFALNPIVDFSLDAVTLEPAAMGLYKLGRVAAVGLEYYSAWGSIARFSGLARQEHYLFEVFNLLAVANFELNAGIGEGLTPASTRFVVKAIFGYALP
jgi:hypothetical protein